MAVSTTTHTTSWVAGTVGLRNRFVQAQDEHESTARGAPWQRPYQEIETASAALARAAEADDQCGTGEDEYSRGDRGAGEGAGARVGERADAEGE